VKLTAATITDAQIRALRDSSGERSIRRLCKVALNDAPTYLRADVGRDARVRLAEILNARTKETA
jgi:hypothetical protein